MQRKKSTLFIITLSLLSLVSGCGKTQPQSSGTIPPQTQSLFEMDTVDNIFADTERLQSLEFDNLDMSDVRVCDKPERVAKLHWQVVDDFNEKVDALFEDFIGDRYDEACFVPDDGTYDVEAPSYKDTDKGIYLYLGRNGWFWFADFSYIPDFSGDLHDYIMKYTDAENETDLCFFMYEKYEDAAFQTIDGIVSVSEAAAAAELYAAERLHQYTPGFVWRAKYVIVTQYDDENHCFNIMMEKNFDGMPLSSTWIKGGPEGVKNNEDMTRGEIDVFSLNRIVYFYNHQSLKEISDSEEYERIITIEGALDIISDELSAYKKYDVRYVALESRIKSDEPREEVYIRGEPWKHGEKATSIPCWVVYFETRYEMEVYAVVNAISGEIDFFDNTR